MLQLTFFQLFLPAMMISCQYFGQSSFPQSSSPVLASSVQINSKKISSKEQMVDYTNQFGINVLYLHSLNNKDNIAFSAYGLLSTVIALYEGAGWESKTAIEMRQALQLPLEHQILRVGYRDIHRRLRSYFHNQENLLSGIIFNKENITIRSEYEEVLRFYGYDLATYNVFNKSSTAMVDEPEIKPEPATMANVTTTPTLVATTTENSEEMESTTAEETDDNDEEVEIEEETTMMPTTTTTVKATTSKKTTVRTTTPTAKTTPSTTTTRTTTPPTTTTVQTTIPTTIPTTTTRATTTTRQTTRRSPVPPLAPITTSAPTTRTVPRTIPPNAFKPTMPPTTMEDETTLPATTFSPPTSIPAALLANTDRGARFLGRKRQQHMVTNNNRFITLDSPKTTQKRNKRLSLHNEEILIFDQNNKYYPRTYEAEYYVQPNLELPSLAYYGNAPFLGNYQDDKAYVSHIVATSVPHYHEISIPHQPITINTNSRPNNWNSIQRNDNGADVEHYFYLKDRDSIRVPFKIYNTILWHAYIPGLHSHVLKFELDSDDYNLLVISPDPSFGLDALIATMKNDGVREAYTLRRINERLERKWIRAQLPKFNLKGNVLFTNDLQNMGVTDLFEPSRADFSIMTEEKSIYIKHLEQSIDLTIRTHSVKTVIDSLTRPKKYEEININYPFLFFIMDKEIDLAIISGRILNPLNSRIQ